MINHGEKVLFYTEVYPYEVWARAFTALVLPKQDYTC